MYPKLPKSLKSDENTDTEITEINSISSRLILKTCKELINSDFGGTPSKLRAFLSRYESAIFIS